MRVAFDARCMQGRPRGMGVYAVNLLRALVRLPNPPAITLLCDADRPDPQGLPGGGLPVLRARGHNEIVWEQLVLPRLARGFDLIHAPANGGPLRAPLPLVVTVHDAIFMRPYRDIAERGSFRQWVGHLYRTRIYPRIARRAAAVLTVSEASRADIVTRMGVPPGRITVTPEAVSESFTAAVPPAEAVIRSRYELPGPYFLAMGAYEKRKNIPILFRALARLAATRHEAPLLALAGAENLRASGYREEARALNVDGFVRFLPYVPEADLKGLQAAAVAFLMPSRKEGFGLPLLEAMSLGTPVAASSIPAHVETVGDATALLDPDDETGWASVLERLAGDAAFRRALSDRGRARAAGFSWDAAAAATAGVYEGVAR